MSFNKNKLATSIILTFIFLLSISSVSLAYTYYSGGYISANIEIENRTSYHTEFTAAMNAWNSTSTPVWITTVPGSGGNFILDDVYATTWRGLYTPRTLEYILWGRATKFSIKLNRKYLVNDNETIRQSTITHELGHAFCLDDNPSDGTTPNNSIMNYSRNKSIIYLPQKDDIDGVNNAY